MDAETSPPLAGLPGEAASSVDALYKGPPAAGEAEHLGGRAAPPFLLTPSAGEHSIHEASGKDAVERKGERGIHTE